MKIYSNNLPAILANQFDFTENKFDKDIKLALQYEYLFNDETTTLFKVLGVPVIGYVRLDKVLQSIVLEKFNRRTGT